MTYKMKTRLRTLAGALVLVALAVTASAGQLDTDAYARVLDHFVTAEGTVRYVALQAAPVDLDRTPARLAATTTPELKALAERCV